MTKYKFNQILFISSFSLLLAIFGLLFFYPLNWFFSVFVFIVISFLLHYQFNLVHIASHFQLSKNRTLNTIFGSLSAIVSGTTLASFTQTHLIHHQNVGNKEKDPDYFITNGHGLFWIPFKIWYQDYFFFKNDLHKKPSALLNYIISRSIQILVLVGFIFTGSLNLFIFFWLLPAWLVGYLNGLFLFYFPHYTTKTVENLIVKKDLNFFEKNYLRAIQISRVYHEKHHLKINENRNYFPVYSYFKDK